MTPCKPTRKLRVLAGTLLLVNCLLVSCKAKDEANAEPTTQANQTYQVRGVVVRLNSQKGTVDIQHEEIPQFANERGEKVGMAAMTMPFHLSSRVASSGLQVGDKVAFDLEVRWGQQRELFIPKLEQLPAETELRLEQ